MNMANEPATDDEEQTIELEHDGRSATSKALRLFGTGVNALPERVRSALGDDGDGHTAGAARLTAAASADESHQRGCEYNADSHNARMLPRMEVKAVTGAP